MIGIYKITNKINNKIYIGQSWNINDRIRKHKSAECQNKHLKASIDKYGLENFSFKTIICFKDGPFTQKYLDKFERFYIKQYNSINKINGYNKNSWWF